MYRIHDESFQRRGRKDDRVCWAEDDQASEINRQQQPAGQITKVGQVRGKGRVATHEISEGETSETGDAESPETTRVHGAGQRRRLVRGMNRVGEVVATVQGCG